jgi:alanyl-tRNA synthetase
MTMNVNQIRKAFLEFFAKNNHTIVPSSPLVPHNDPTLMFTNSGMVQFKNVFTGEDKRAYTRASTSQKCVRAGGKHNDLDNVGYTARHHTFFEMLGNFSFGDYFKEHAIEYAWKFLTEEVKLPKDKLYVTVYHTDDEAFNLWKKIASLSDDRIIRIPTNDNFWSMGDTGPCGPCSEIFFDHGPGVWGGLPGTPEGDGDRYIEIWNLVFMQFEQLASGERIALPKPSIDTGMGLERIAAVLQHVHDNYEIDLFRALINASESLTGVKAAGEHHASHKVIADHLRSSSFLVADGVLPSNEGRGYVLRRIMRRAMRHAHQLGSKEPLMYRLVPALTSEMGDAYPELKRAEKLITEVLKQEEERFKDTLGRGLKLLEQEAAPLKAGDSLKGDVAFKLYDTYGFPLDLTKDILRNKNISVDDAGFEVSMKEQKDKARAAWAGSGEKATDTVWFDIINEFGSTEFLGYELENAQGQVIGLVVDGKRVDAVKEIGKEFSVITNQTPFYGESGGQMGDTGEIFNKEKGLKLSVKDTKKYLKGLHVHVSQLEQGSIKVGDAVNLHVSIDHRTKLRANHSATHLLHAVLRKTLGEHVTQKGSLVAHDKLRFDISHPKAISIDEITAIEKQVNKLIYQNSEVATKLMSTEKAIEGGAMALFGEKYDDEVRVVTMGIHADGDFSIELCGGTHVKRTGDIGLFKIVSESAISAGVRRIEAVTQEAAVEFVQEQESFLREASDILKVKKSEIADRLKALLEERKKLEKALNEAKKSAALGSKEDLSSQIEKIGEINFLCKTMNDVPAKDLRNIAEGLIKQIGSGVVTLFTEAEGKVSVVTAVSPDLSGKFNAADLVRDIAAALGGSGGGGKPELAQAGGNDASKIGEAVEQVKKKFVS